MLNDFNTGISRVAVSLTFPLPTKRRQINVVKTPLCFAVLRGEMISIRRQKLVAKPIYGIPPLKKIQSSADDIFQNKPIPVQFQGLYSNHTTDTYRDGCSSF